MAFNLINKTRNILSRILHLRSAETDVKSTFAEITNLHDQAITILENTIDRYESIIDRDAATFQIMNDIVDSQSRTISELKGLIELHLNP